MIPRTGLPLLALLIVGACASANSPPLPPRPEVGRVEAMPTDIGDYRLAEVRRFPVAAAGAMYMYRGGPLSPDVYLYPLTDRGPSPTDDPYVFVRAEAELFPQVLEVYREQGRFDEFEIVADSAFSIPGRQAVPGWHTRARLRPRDGWHDSHQYLFSFPGQMVKVRITQPAGASDPHEIDRFVRELVDQLTEPAG